MNHVYNYLNEIKPEKKSKEVCEALLISLMSLEGSYLKTKDNFLEEQLRINTFLYAESNGWVYYVKKKFLKELNIPLGDLKRELKLLESEEKIKYHRFAKQTFIELIEN